MQYSINLLTIVKNNFGAFDLHTTYYRVFPELITMEKIFRIGLCHELLFLYSSIPGRVYILF